MILDGIWRTKSLCHNPFPELSPTNHIHPVTSGFTLFLCYHVLQVTPINPDHAQPCLEVPSLLHHGQGQGPEHWLECTPSTSGTLGLPKIMWPSCDDHTTTFHPSHFFGWPPSWQSWDLGSQPCLFSIYFILLCANI